MVGTYVRPKTYVEHFFTDIVSSLRGFKRNKYERNVIIFYKKNGRKYHRSIGF